eukprot:324893-Rhodomonas_salina.2
MHSGTVSTAVRCSGLPARGPRSSGGQAYRKTGNETPYPASNTAGKGAHTRPPLGSSFTKLLHHPHSLFCQFVKMASIVFDKLKQPVFNLFYIMTEGVQVEAGFAAYRKTVFLLFVDVLQVLRVLCSLRYGWTKDTQGIIQKTDIVYMFTDLVSAP